MKPRRDSVLTFELFVAPQSFVQPLTKNKKKKRKRTVDYRKQNDHENKLSSITKRTRVHNGRL